jgi:branched-chain amino acid transport system permease protein
MDLSFILQIVLNGLVLGAIYALVASGFSLVFGILNILNFAHGQFYMLAVYSTYYLLQGRGIPYPLAGLFSILIIGGLGLIVERILFRRAEADEIASVVIGVGLLMIIGGASLIGFSEDARSIVNPYPGSLKFLNISMSIQRVLIVIVSIIVMLALGYFTQRSKLGLAMRATAQDREAAVLHGININQVYLLTFGIAAGLAAIAAVLMGPIISIDPSIGLPIMFKCLIVVVLGGLGSILGAVLGGLSLGLIESFGYTLIGYSAELVGFAFVIAVLLIRPTGIKGVSIYEG